jgi:hypothetical protein
MNSPLLVLQWPSHDRPPPYRGRVTTYINPDGLEERSFYNFFGWLTRRDVQRVANAFDITHFKYAEPRGLLTKLTDPSDHETTCEYNASGYGVVSPLLGVGRGDARAAVVKGKPSER